MEILLNLENIQNTIETNDINKKNIEVGNGFSEIFNELNLSKETNELNLSKETNEEYFNDTGTKDTVLDAMIEKDILIDTSEIDTKNDNRKSDIINLDYNFKKEDDTSQKYKENIEMNELSNQLTHIGTGNHVTNVLKNDEIGTNKIDSVKCTLENIKSNSIEELLIKNIVVSNEQDEFNSLDTDNLDTGNLDVIDENTSETEILDSDFKVLTKELSSEVLQGEQAEEIKADQKNILKQIKEGLNRNSTVRNVQIMLKPQSLGKVNLNLKFYNNALHINVFVENRATEEVLRQNLDEISKMIDPTGTVAIGKINVSKIDDYLEDVIGESKDLKGLFNKHLGIRIVSKANGTYKL